MKLKPRLTPRFYSLVIVRRRSIVSSSGCSQIMRQIIFPGVFQYRQESSFFICECELFLSRQPQAPWQNSRNQDSPYIPVSTSANSTMGPLKAINGNAGRSRLPDKEKLFPERSSSHPVPGLLHTQFPTVDLSVRTVGPHFLSSSFSGGLGEGVHSAEMLSLGSLSPFPGAWVGGIWLKLAFWSLCCHLYSSSCQDFDGRVFFMIGKVRWRGRTLFLSDTKTVSLRQS